MDIENRFESRFDLSPCDVGGWELIRVWVTFVALSWILEIDSSLGYIRRPVMDVKKRFKIDSRRYSKDMTIVLLIQVLRNVHPDETVVA